MSKKFPLVVESHPPDYDGYEFITLIQYNDDAFLVVVDNVTKKYIYGYVLDLCGPEKIDEEMFIKIAFDWFKSNGDRFPISIEFSRKELTGQTEKILRAFPLDYVTRVIGPLPQFNMDGPTSIRKRKRKDIPNNIEVVRKPLSGTV